MTVTDDLTTAGLAPAGTAEPQWLLPPFFMLRIGGLPIDTVDGLRFTDSAGWAARVLELERRLTASGQELADTLQQTVSQHLDDSGLRKHLINLRRDIFNLRRPKGAAIEAAAGLLTPQWAGRLHEWLRDYELHQQELAAGAELFAAETAARRDRLRELADDPDLRNGVLLSSPSLDQYLPTYLKAPAAKLSKRARRVERSILEYLLRTACKTSPFSTLTTVCLGSYVDGVGRPLLVELDGPGKISRSRLNMAILARLSAIALAEPKVRPDLPVRVTTGWRAQQGRIRYLRRHRTLGEDDDAAVTIDPVHEALFYLPTGPLLGEILDLLADGAELRMAELVERLCTKDDRAREVVEEYLDHLLRLGLLVVPNFQLDIHHPDPFANYRDGLRELDRPWAGELADRLDKIAGLVDQYPDLGVDQRREALSGIKQELTGAHEELGRADVPVPRTLVYEDATLPASRVVADRGLWERSLLPGLRELGRLLPVFDMNLTRRLATKGFFTARYGSGGHCADFLSFAHEFQQDFFEHFTMRIMKRRAFDDNNEYVKQENWFKQPEITGLDRARAEIAKRVNGLYDALPAEATDLVLDQDFVDSIADLVPTTLGQLQPWSFFLQVADDGEHEPLVVVNRIYSGLTLLFSRFAHLFTGDGASTELAAGLREALRKVQPEGVVFAELKGGYDATNLNLHPVVTDYELVCPGELSFRPAAEQVHVEDLVIEHNEREQRVLLRSKRLGVEVIPVYLGFLLPMALPEVQQVLLNFSYTSMAQVDLWGGTTVPLPGKTIASYPRISYRNVVLQRRMWKLHPDYLPQPEAGRGEERWFLDWARWREANGVPRRVFVTSDGVPAAPKPEDAAPTQGGGGPRGEHKPLYVDFDNYFSLTLLDAMARGTDARLVMTEMLPDHDQLWLRHEGKSHVTELTVELDRIQCQSRTGE